MTVRQDIIDLFDRFTHGDMGRRAFMDRLVLLTGSVAAASALLPLLENNYARAAIVAEDDPRLATGTTAYQGPDSEIRGYLARAVDKVLQPAVIVIHENRGLNPHIQDVARRIALEGFLAFAPDMLSPAGGTPDDSDQARDMIGKLEPEANIARLAAAVPFLASHVESTGKVGAIGFCWGGTRVNELAAASPDLAAAVAYYGRQIPEDKVASIEAPLLLHYAGNDKQVNAGIEAYEAALKAAGKTYTAYIYEGAQHAFNNDTNEARYNKEAADLAWGRTVEFLKTSLA